MADFLGRLTVVSSIKEWIPSDDLRNLLESISSEKDLIGEIRRRANLTVRVFTDGILKELLKEEKEMNAKKRAALLNGNIWDEIGQIRDAISNIGTPSICDKTQTLESLTEYLDALFCKKDSEDKPIIEFFTSVIGEIVSSQQSAVDNKMERYNLICTKITTEIFEHKNLTGNLVMDIINIFCLA
jgi:hypothetical protein